jgi:hypothetical protein
VCVSLFYVIDTGSTGSPIGLSVFCGPFSLFAYSVYVVYFGFMGASAMERRCNKQQVADRHAIRLAAEMATPLHTRSHIDPNDQAALRNSARKGAQGDAILNASF